MQYGSSTWQGQNSPKSPRKLTEREVLLTVDALSQSRDAVLTHRAAAEMLRSSQRAQDAINRLNARLRHALRVLVALVAARLFRPLPDARAAARPASPNAPNAAFAARLA